MFVPNPGGYSRVTFNQRLGKILPRTTHPRFPAYDIISVHPQGSRGPRGSGRGPPTIPAGSCGAPRPPGYSGTPRGETPPNGPEGAQGGIVFYYPCAFLKLRTNIFLIPTPPRARRKGTGGAQKSATNSYQTKGHPSVNI